MEIYSFRIAGGVILLIIAIEMFLGMKLGTKSSAAEEEKEEEKEEEESMVLG